MNEAEDSSYTTEALGEVCVTVDRPGEGVFLCVSLQDLEAMSADQMDALPFGVVGLSEDGMVEIYNGTESRMAGLPVASVIGTAFFLQTAQCMNNYLVAQRFADEPELDVTLPYVLTFRMRPTPVILRLLKRTAVPRSYILIQR